jgi:hypothetical protein
MIIETNWKKTAKVKGALAELQQIWAHFKK